MNYREMKEFMNVISQISLIAVLDESYIYTFLSDRAKSNKNTLLTEAKLAKNHVFMTGNFEEYRSL